MGMKVTLPTLKQALSANIKRIRKEQGISQEKLALKADVDRSYMSELERCLANPSIEALLKIGNALDVTPSELLQSGKKKP
jgi:transcriptional regulator with XRE-family HTH domain